MKMLLATNSSVDISRKCNLVRVYYTCAHVSVGIEHCS